MGTISIGIAVGIAIASLGDAFIGIIKDFLKVKNSKHITLIKKDSQKITISSDFNKADSSKLAKFIK